MYRKYYSYNDMPVPVIADKPSPKEVECPEPVVQEEKKVEKSSGLGGLLNKLETDDIILILVALALLMDDCDDKLLLAAIAFVLFTS